MKRLVRISLPIVVAIVLVAVGAWQGLEWKKVSDRADSRASASKIAQAQVLDLMSLTPDNVTAKLSAMAKRTTGSFKRQLEGITTTFASTIASSQINATGSIAAAAVERFDGHRAQVLVASDAQVTEAKSEKPTDRTYRIRISLVRLHGQWSIDNMEFVR